MNKHHQITHGNRTINFCLERRQRKTLEISVYPDLSIKVIAPMHAVFEAILEKVKKRAVWILRQINFFEQFYPKRTMRYYLSGESHLYLGREYRLKVIQGLQKKVTLARGQLFVETHSPKRTDVTHYVLEKWYLESAKTKFIERLEYCLRYFPNKTKFKPKSIIVRQLSNRWGSMTKAGNLVLNRQLIKVPTPCIDYVIIHELCHMRYPDHSRDFYEFLSKMLPDWKKYKMKLEKMML